MKTASKILGLFLLLLTASAQAGTLYKCKDAKGVVSYQQTTCPEAKQDAGAVGYRPVRDNPGLSWSGQAEKKRQEQISKADYISQNQSNYTTHYAKPVKTTNATPPKSGIMAMYPDLSTEEARRRIENLSLSPEGRAVLRAMSGQTLKASPQQRGKKEPEQGTKQIQDQNGNYYTQPPGSAFATDNKTGKQCFVYGNFVDCK